MSAYATPTVTSARWTKAKNWDDTGHYTVTITGKTSKGESVSFRKMRLMRFNSDGGGQAGYHVRFTPKDGGRYASGKKRTAYLFLGKTRANVVLALLWGHEASAKAQAPINMGWDNYIMGGWDYDRQSPDGGWDLAKGSRNCACPPKGRRGFDAARAEEALATTTKSVRRWNHGESWETSRSAARRFAASYEVTGGAFYGYGPTRKAAQAAAKAKATGGQQAKRAKSKLVLPPKAQWHEQRYYEYGTGKPSSSVQYHLDAVGASGRKLRLFVRLNENFHGKGIHHVNEAVDTTVRGKDVPLNFPRYIVWGYTELRTFLRWYLKEV